MIPAPMPQIPMNTRRGRSTAVSLSQLGGFSTPMNSQERVHPAGLEVEHPLPDEDAGDERDHVRQEEQGPEQRSARAGSGC